MANAVPEARQEEREALLAELEVGGYLTDPLLEEAMLAVPRHYFIPPELREVAYEDRPLPIGFGQTVSAPHMVAMMTSALQLKRGHRVLEIGAGVGYHAAVIKGVVGPEGKVVSIEYLPELVALARANLKKAGSDVEVREGDGFEGWPEEAPFDAIYVTCAIPTVPETLLDQLRPGGHFVAPLGITRCQLVAGRRTAGGLELDDLGPCLFVNAQGRLGRQEPDDEEPEDPFGDLGDDDDDDGGMTTLTP